jgi:hypothetical protein
MLIETKTEITSQRIADLFITAIESGDPVTRGWCNGVFLKSPGDKAPDDPHKGPWYGNPRIYEDPDLKLKIVEIDDEAKPTSKNHVIGLKEIQEGLQKLASGQYAHHFRDIVDENDDAATADIFLQFILFGEEKYA